MVGRKLTRNALFGIEMKEIIVGLIVAFLAYVASQIQSASISSYKFFSRKITEKDYKVFVAAM